MLRFEKLFALDIYHNRPGRFRVTCVVLLYSLLIFCLISALCISQFLLTFSAIYIERETHTQSKTINGRNQCSYSVLKYVHFNLFQYNPSTYETSNTDTSVMGNGVTASGSKWERYVDTDRQDGDCDHTWDGDDMDELNGVVVTMGRNKDVNSGQGRGKKRYMILDMYFL